MAFSRRPALGERPTDDGLTRDMVGIGMNFAANANPSALTEETLVHSSELGMDEHLRVLAVLTTWLGVHHSHINADKLLRCLSEDPSACLRAYIGLPSHTGSRRTADSPGSRGSTTGRQSISCRSGRTSRSNVEVKMSALPAPSFACRPAHSATGTLTCSPLRCSCAGTLAIGTACSWVQPGALTSGRFSRASLM